MLDKILAFIADAFSAKQIDVTSSYATINAAKRCGIVVVRFALITNLAANSWTTLGTLPDGWRPKVEVYLRPDNPEKNFKLRIVITTSGEIRIYNYGAAISGTTNIRESMTFVSGGYCKDSNFNVFGTSIQIGGGLNVG